jgi:predicted dehydrogenase
VRLQRADGSTERFRAEQSKEQLFAAQAAAFLEACAGRIDPRLATAEDGVAALAVCDAARRSSETRREEPVEYFK